MRKILVQSDGFRFEAAHLLPEHQGACRFLHGHSYKMSVTVSQVHNDTVFGMVVDFGFLKKLVKEFIVDKVDHTDLRESMKLFENWNHQNPTTAELMAICFFETLQGILNERYNYTLQVEEITLNETEHNKAICRRMV